MGGGVAYFELLNDGMVKTLEETKVRDYFVGVRETVEVKNPSIVRISFRDNFGREYAKDVTIPASEVEDV
jgi:hypothetical protein